MNSHKQLTALLRPQARPAMAFMGASPAGLVAAGRATAFCPKSAPLGLRQHNNIASMRPAVAASVFTSGHVDSLCLHTKLLESP